MDDIYSLAEQVGRMLQKKGLMLATAESCTGGGVGYAITEIPGSSDWFDCGFITYSTPSKTELLDVPEAQIAQFGTVSEEVVEAMAEGVADDFVGHHARVPCLGQAKQTRVSASSVIQRLHK